MKVLVIIPCYNEEDSIIQVVEDVKKQNVDYIVINDGSTDNTKQVLKDKHVHFLNLVNNLGIGGAMQTGYKYALRHGYDIAIQLDGDGQHDASYIERIIEPIQKKEANMVIGSRFVGKRKGYRSTSMRRAGIHILSFLFLMITDKNIKDMTSGFRAVDKEIIQSFAMSYPHEYPEPVTNLFMARKGYNLVEVPVRMKKRQYGTSSITKWKTIYYMLNVVLLFFIVFVSIGDDFDAL